MEREYWNPRIFWGAATAILVVLWGAVIVVSGVHASVSGEWTFEMARRRWKPLVRPVVHVGIPGNQ